MLSPQSLKIALEIINSSNFFQRTLLFIKSSYSQLPKFIIKLIYTQSMNLNSKKKQQAMKAYLRLKPLNPNQSSILTMASDRTVVVKGQGQYKFDKVFTGQALNAEIFQEIGDPLIKHSLQGYNASVLAYGQTSSGKTYTMKGDIDNEGIIPQVIRKLFSSIQESSLTARISISYMEIYNENIIDLLSSSQNSLEIQQKYMKNVIVTNLSETAVEDVESAMQLFDEGETRRKTSSNNINLNSSRSHTIFRIGVTVVGEDLSKTESFINMVDLAGSEGVNRTKAEGNTKKEGENINKSILALTNVFRGMSQKLNYVNFRDSKLTRLLQSSFCSNSRSIVICTVNPLTQNYQETINTLKFGAYATDIKLAVKKNLKQSNLELSGTSGFRSQYAYSEKNGSFELMEGERLTAAERIQFEQNKRIIAQQRQQCREYRDLIKDLKKKVQFFELDNHQLRINVENLEQIIKVNEERAQFNRENGLNDDERYIYEKEIANMREQMNVMADRYEGVNQLYNKTLKNEKYLVDRVAKYESEITLLKQTAVKQTEKQAKNKPKTPIKINPNLIAKPKWEQPPCPLTIGSIVRLKASIIELKKTLFDANEQIAKLMQQRNQFEQRVRELEDEQQDRRHNSKYNSSYIEQKQIRSLHIRIKKLKREIDYHKNYQQKLLKKLKDKTYRGMEEIDQFHEWYVKKMHDQSEKKRTQGKQNFQQPRSIRKLTTPLKRQSGRIEC